MKDARYTAVQVVLRQSEDHAYSNLLLDGLLKKNALTGRDAAFASALAYGVLERRLTIDHILRAHCTRPPEQLSPAVLAILRTGIYQLCYMDGVEDYAAVSESVALTRQFGAGKASGFVNGVLRSFLRADKQIPPPPKKAGRAEQLSVEYSCPAWLVQIWLDAYGEDATLRMLAASLGKPPLYLRANTLRTTGEQLVQTLAAEDVVSHCDMDFPACVTVESGGAPEKLAAFEAGLFHVQDRASQLCAAALDAQPGERVLDVCAAPGGKSFTIAQMMQGEGELVARDLRDSRTRLIAAGAQRLGLSCIETSSGDASSFDINLGFFHRVLCDVPCSGFGIIRRKPEIKYKTAESVQNLPEIQYKILQTSSQYLQPGGALVYSTCTLMPAENEQVTARFLKEHPDFSQVSQKTTTGEQESDGFFVCVMRKNLG